MEPLGPLTVEAARRLLAGLGLVDESHELRVEALPGGVSSTIYLAESTRRRLVLKQPLRRFRVPDDWVVSDRRVFVEHAFLRALGPRLPSGSLLRALAFAPQWRTLVVEAAAPGWTSWKARLLAGEADPAVAEKAGALLAEVHQAGEDHDLRSRFQNPELFDQQRLDPYVRSAARRAPEVSGPLVALIDLFLQRQDLVHGDFSPKNLLTDGVRIALVDHEVAARGDAAFDVAFMLTHLVAKSIHAAGQAEKILECATRFLETYRDARPADDAFERRALRFLAGLMLARVVGKSRLEYLTPDEGAAVRRLATAWLQDPPRHWRDAHAAVQHSVAR